jgi:branched-subunit amino acid transport protein
MSPSAIVDPDALLIWAMMIGIGVVTFLIRFVPIALLSRLRLSEWLKRALRFVPPAVMMAIIVPSLFFASSALTINPDLPRLMAAAFATLIAWKTRSTLLTVVLGMCALWGLQVFLR